MKPGIKNSYKSLTDLEIDGKNYKIYSLLKAENNGLNGISKLPKSLKVLLENLLRYEDDVTVTKKQIEAIKELSDGFLQTRRYIESFIINHLTKKT